ncbi:MAG: hypothetical protein JXA46_00165 [Dehalococcoidales bacterium]|nr:hypothetical protein [Dehalococcoidales bacterium]
MLAQVVLTPAESKKLIAKAIARLDVVKQAATDGMIVIHPSSSTYFIIEELTGSKPRTNYWVCGVVTPRGMCVEMAMASGDRSPRTEKFDPGKLRGLWAIKKGKVVTDGTTSELMEQMTPGDVYIKGVNALDSQGNVGILVGERGGLGVVLSAWKKKQFTLIFPAGLEKLIPISVRQAAIEAKQAKYEYGMGLPAGLFAYPSGRSITEIDAVKILSGAVAVPIASGGLGGAEGAATLIIKGRNKQVKDALGFIEQSKGAKLPALRLSNCSDCSVPHCRFPVGDKHWVQGM